MAPIIPIIRNDCLAIDSPCTDLFVALFPILMDSCAKRTAKLFFRTLCVYLAQSCEDYTRRLR